jgi:homoserine dehydrogenase
MLSKAQDEHLDFGEALNIAQTLGYAESNPSLDVDGYDAAYKLQIICAHAFGLIIDAKDIARIGIRAIGKEEFKYAREKGYKIKLVAQAYKTSDNAIAAFVMPKFVNEQSPLFRVDDVFNGVITETAFADRQFFSGKGAGAYPTASAVLSDISALSYQYRYEYKKLQSGSVGELEQNGSLQVYVRVPYELARIAHSVFESIEVIQQDKKGLCLTGLAKARNLYELAGNFPEAAIVLLENAPAIASTTLETLEHAVR